MSQNPIKLFAFVGVAAVIGAGVLTQHVEPLPPAPVAQGETVSPANAGQPASSWWSEYFGGIQIRREKADVPVAPRQEAERVPPTPVRAASGFGSVVLKADQAGHYRAKIEIDGQNISMLVDTGATIVALRSEDATRLGINPSPSDFNVPISTANGEIKAARTSLREVRLDNITVSDVPAIVMPTGVLSQSLLGMSFMKKLSSFQSSDGELVLKP